MSLNPLPAWINHTCIQYWSCRGPMIAPESHTEGETLPLVKLILWNQQKHKQTQYQLYAHHWERLLHLPWKNIALFSLDDISRRHFLSAYKPVARATISAFQNVYYTSITSALGPTTISDPCGVPPLDWNTVVSKQVGQSTLITLIYFAYDYSIYFWYI